MRVLSRVFLILIAASVASLFSACVTLPMSSSYAGPTERPVELDQYYGADRSYGEVETELVRRHDKFKIQQYRIASEAGEIIVDYYTRGNKSDELILVFPVLGGKNIFSKYFATYFTKKGYEAAIVHRKKDFKDPDKFDQLEEILRQNVIRDRIAIDFFEDKFAKKRFGAFGISRGAINVAITASIDPRLKYNVLAMGGADLPRVFRDSAERGIRRYTRNVMKNKSLMSENEVYELLKERIKTDPKLVAGHLDARNTLMILSAFDRAVPFRYGIRLRREIGNPRTIFLPAGHYSSILYTQFVTLIPPKSPVAIFPLDYVETESLDFFEKSFKKKKFTWKALPYRILQFPTTVLSGVIDRIF